MLDFGIDLPAAPANFPYTLAVAAVAVMNANVTNLVLYDHLAAWMLLGVLALVLLLVFVFAAFVLQIGRASCRERV